MASKLARDQFGYPTQNNEKDHGRTESAKSRGSNPKAGSFSDRSIKMPPMGDSKFKDRNAVNPLGAKNGNPAGM